MSGRIITLKYDKERYPEPKTELPSPSPLEFSDRFTSTQQAPAPAAPKIADMDHTPTKIVKLQYRRRRTSSSQSSPVKSSERRSINRTPTPSTAMAAGDLINVPRLSRESSGLYSGGASPTRVSSPEARPLRESSASSSNSSAQHNITASANSESVQEALATMAADESPQSYLHSVHIVATRLHLLKEAYRAVQAVKRRKLQNTDAPVAMGETGAPSSHPAANFALESSQYPLSSPVPTALSSPAPQNTIFLNKQHLVEDSQPMSSSQASEDSAADEPEPVSGLKTVGIMEG